jgi:probable phosphomutase (TIGR03848 family)
MTLLLLIRHGHTPTAGKVLTGWERGVHLTEAGRAQADSLVGRLEGVPLAAIYSSPLERCRETAAPLAASRGLAVRARRGLIETGYGEWTGRSIRQLKRTALWRTLQRSPSAVRFPGGESLRDVQARGVDAALAIAAEHPGKTVALVTHADVVRLILAHFAGMHPDLFERLTVEPGSISAVALGGDGAVRVVKVNDTGGLRSLAPPPAERRPSRRAEARTVRSPAAKVRG